MLLFCCVAIATGYLNRVFAPEGEILSFASPKESIQRKGDPDSAQILRFSLLTRVFRRGFPAPLKTSGIPAAPLTG